MEDEPRRAAPEAHYFERRIERKGLRPRYAAAMIATAWLAAIVVFGFLQTLFDSESFGSLWQGMWWATQTVTTVGYGDQVPGQASGQALAMVLMIGGLSLFAVVTGTITSAFVSKAQERSESTRRDPMLEKIERLSEEVAALRRELGGSAPDEPPGDEPPGRDGPG